MNNTTIKKFGVTHVNIRLSISFLLMKLIVLEVIAAILIIVFHAVLLPYMQNLKFSLFNIPIFLSLIFIKIVLSFYVIFLWLNEYYEITAEAVIYRKGFLIKHEERYPLEHVRLIEVTQNLLGKILNYGTISLYDQRRNKYLDMYQIHNPIRYGQILEEIIPKLEERKTLVREHMIEPENTYQ